MKLMLYKSQIVPVVLYDTVRSSVKELYDLFNDMDVVQLINLQRLCWPVYVVRMVRELADVGEEDDHIYIRCKDQMMQIISSYGGEDVREVEADGNAIYGLLKPAV